MYLTEQKTERLSKKDLMIMLEHYPDDSLICIGLQMQQGYVGFFDLEQDTKDEDKYRFILNSDCFNKWYKEDIEELKEKINEQQSIISILKKENEQLLYKLQQIEEYLQIKIDECKNHKKMKEIVFGVEQQVGYEKALLGFQKGLKRRLNDG